MEINIRKELTQLADEKYRLFSSKLIPNVNNIIGVKLPLLRKLAKRLIDEEKHIDYLNAHNLLYFEEVMLQGMIIGYLNTSWKLKQKQIESFIPKIDNWSICDSFCTGLKFNKQEKEEVWDFLQPYLLSDEAYEIRFAVVMLLLYFVDENYTDSIFESFNKIKHDNYYVKMAIAWAISIFFRELPHITMPYLKNNKLDNWTYNKALQKITESLAVDEDVKKTIRSMKI